MLDVLFRTIRVYTTTSALSSLASKPEFLLPIFRPRSEGAAKLHTQILGAELTAKVQKQAVDSTIVAAQKAVSAACLVFAHAFADTSLEDLCL